MKPPAQGFNVHIEWVPSLTDKQIETFTDDFIKHLESLGLETGGGCGPEDADFCVCCSDQDRYVDVTATQRRLVCEWLVALPGVVDVGQLFDVMNESEEP